MVSDCCGLWVSGLVCAALTVAYYIRKSQGNASTRAANRAAVERTQAKRTEQLDSLEKELSSDDEAHATRRKDILQLPMMSLQKALQEEKYTATQVLDAFRWKAVEVTRRLNCVTEFIVEAESEAEKLDIEFAGKAKPPLFGLPFSVKDNFWVKGYSTTRGLGSELEKPAPADCSFVSHLRLLGAVPFCRTNVPQTLLQYVSTNPVFGTTAHPLDAERTPGGSSGGECALHAAGGSAFGIGSDLGGSLRIPAAFCGLASLKPTAARFVIKNCHEGIPGVPKLALGNGFFTKDCASLKFLMDSFLTAQYQATIPRMAPVPFGSVNNLGEKAPLKLGYFNDDGWLKPVPAMQRGVDEAVAALKERGHILIPFVVPRPAEAMALIVRNMVSDNGAYLLELMSVNDVDPLLKPSNALLGLPLCLRSVLACLLKGRFPQIGALAGAINKGPADVRRAGEGADEYVREFTDYWESLGLDGLVCPAFPFPAPRHDAPAKLSGAAFSTCLFNLLDYPAGVVKVSSVTAADEGRLATEYPSPSAVPLSLLRNPVEKMVKDAVVGSEGLPVVVQVATLPYHDELCLHIMTELEMAIKK